MQREKKALGKIGATIIIVLVLLGAAGAYFYYESISAPKSVTLTVVVVSGWNDKTVEMAAKDFEAQHPNVHFDFVYTTFNNVLQKEELVESQGNASTYDIFTWSPTMSGAIASYVTPLGPYVKSYGYNLSDLPSAFLGFGGEYYNLSTKTTELIGLPLDTSLEILFYRKDVFSNATLAQEFQSEYGVPFNPNDWTNWTEVVWASRFVVTHGVTKYGLIFSDDPSHDLIDTYPAVFYWWYMRNSSLNGGTRGGVPPFNVLFTPGLTPSFNNSDGVAALQTIKDLLQYEPAPTVEIVTYSDIQSMFAAGEGAMDLAWSGFYDTLFNVPSKSQVAGKVGMALLPGGYAEAGGCFMGIAKYSHNKDLAFQFLAFLTSDKEAASLYFRGGFPPAALGAMRIIASNSTYAAEWSFYQKAASVAFANPPAIPIAASELMPSLNTALFNYLTGKVTDPNQALQTAASQWSSYVKQYLSS